MIRRYDLRRSDNYLYTGKVSYVCSGSGLLTIATDFPVMRATVSWVVYPFVQDEEMSSSSSTSSSSSSSGDSLSSSSSSSGDSLSTSSSSSDMSKSSESSSSPSEIPVGLPRLYVYSYATIEPWGFTVRYENIPPQVGFIEFSYNAV